MKNNGIQQHLEPKIIPRASHNVSRGEISTNALKVLYRLHNHGFQAFLVGGGVRDAILDLHPKDFDIATNAHPEEVRALFGNCRLIGRRFRLAHVRFGKEIIEVATFRAAAEGNAKHADMLHDHAGRILRDNVYGTIEEDVWRRDFTCNALYYNIADFSIWDYVGGAEDIQHRRLVLIGDADKRLREDPVRMLRAVRFAAKLDFRIDDSVRESIAKHIDLLSSVPPARLFDEFLKMFQTGHAESTFALLRKFRLFGELFPDTEEALNSDEVFSKFVHSALVSTDRRVAAGSSVTPMFLLGVFLWAPVRKHAEQLRMKEKMSEPQALAIATYQISQQQQVRISLPRRFTAPMREMLAMQPRFDVMKGKRAFNLLEHKRFRAAYDFMMLRAEVGDIDPDTARFWTEVQKQNTEMRMQSFDITRKAAGGRRRRRPRRRRGQKSRQP